ncbi:PRC-barrel domain-containing protein [Schnuerera sp. xch1]|uniref:PRC-barrel domain-containing protein n=1 Tax=Schnuerera sp. xch1 TaxID=2874283 RepID=UPI001CBB3823|nr:PRC-barrel domain-containing protein [Schnuerera sp. xch1]MBZ2173707.1 PRC-barrel domain-containing protein [Schnuerera sp. xch1]
MIRYKQLITLKIIDKNTKETIGKIEDIILSDDYRKIKYLIIKNNNLIRNKALIQYNDIRFSNKNQALYLNSIKAFKERLESDIEDDNEGCKFIDKEIRTENDECIGFVKDVVLNKKDGTVNGFIITEGLFEDLLKGRNYIPLLDNIDIKKAYIYVPNSNLILN